MGKDQLYITDTEIHFRSFAPQKGSRETDFKKKELNVKMGDIK